MNIGKLKKNLENNVANGTELLPVGSASRAQRKNYIFKKNLLVCDVDSRFGTISRVMVPLWAHVRKKYDKAGGRRKLWLVDCVTGSIYDPRTKECLSSSSLKLVNCRIDKNYSANQLLSIKFGDV